MSKKSALVIIDVQVNVVKDAYNRDQVLDNIHTLLVQPGAKAFQAICPRLRTRFGVPAC